MCGGGLNGLARLVKYGLCGDANREELARQTILIAGRYVQNHYHATMEDQQDATMEIAERSIARIDRWNTKYAWSTFVTNCVARSVIRDRLIKHKREADALDALRKMP